MYATHIKDLKIQRGVPANEWYFFSSAPVGDGVVDNARLVEKLSQAGFNGILAVETDFLHPDYGNDEHSAVAKSVDELRRLVASAAVVRTSGKEPRALASGSPFLEHTR